MCSYLSEPYYYYHDQSIIFCGTARTVDVRSLTHFYVKHHLWHAEPLNTTDNSRSDAYHIILYIFYATGIYRYECSGYIILCRAASFYSIDEF